MNTVFTKSLLLTFHTHWMVTQETVKTDIPFQNWSSWCAK